MAQIDSDFYRTYCNWQLQERPDWNFFFELYRQPGGGKAVEEALDRFWIDPDVAGIRGFGLMMTKYKGDLDEVKAAYRQRFSKEYLVPAMQGIWDEMLLDAEVTLLLEANKLRSAGKTKKKIRIVVGDIIDRGTGRGARDLQAVLTHSNKYIVARADINGSGAVFEFPAGKLIHPDTLKPVGRVHIRVEPTNGANFAYRHGGAISIPLTREHPRIRRQVGDGLITFEVEKAFYVHMAYPVTVRIGGGAAGVSRVNTRVVPAVPAFRQAGYLHGPAVSEKNGVFRFEELPTGKCTFTYGTRRSTKMISAAETIELEPPAPVKVGGDTVVPASQNAAAVNSQRIQALGQLENFETFEADIENAIGAVSIKFAEMQADFTEKWEIAFETIREQRSLVGKAKGLDAKQRSALRDRLSEKRKVLQERKKATLEEFTRLRKRCDEAQRDVFKKILEEDHRIQTEYSRARDQMYAENKKVGELKKRIEKALREVSSELHHNGSVYKTQAEAETAIVQLERQVADIDDLVLQIQAAVDAANAARERFMDQLDAQQKRRFCREQPAAEPPAILGYVEQARLLLDSLKKNAVAEKAERAAGTVRKRHELRKKNAAEFARLLKEVKRLSAELPDVDGGDFDKKYRQSASRFAELLDDPEAGGREAAELLSKVKTFLDRNEAVIGDLRGTAARGKEPPYAEIERLLGEINDMVTSGVVYAGADYYTAWQPAQDKLISAAVVRSGPGRKLAELEKSLQAAAEDIESYRRRSAAAASETQSLLALAAEIGEEKNIDVGTLLNTLPGRGMEKVRADAGVQR